MELKFELSPWIKTVLILGSEFPMERSNTWLIKFKTTQKFLQIHKKSKFHKQAQAWLQPDQRQKQNLNQGFGKTATIPIHERRWFRADSSIIFTILDVLFNQDSSRRQTVFFLPIDPRDKKHKDSEHIDFSVPGWARYVHSAWKRHQDAVFWVDIDLAIRGGLTFYQTRSNAIILEGTLPAHYISKVERLKTGEVLYERPYLSPRPPPKISLRHDHNWTRVNDELGSTVEHQPVGKLVQQSFGEAPRVKLSKPTQSKPNPICDRSGKPEDTERVLWMKEKRPVYTRSMINVCTKNLALRIDRGNLRNCLKTFASSMLTMEQGNLWKAQAHTLWKNNLFLQNIVTLHHLTRTTSSTVQSTRITSTSTSQECRTRWWNDHMALTFKTWFRRSRTTLSDKHFKVIFNNIDHSTLSAKNQKMRLKLLGTLNCAKYSMLNLKHNAKHAWRIGTLASCTARAGTSYEMIRQRTRSTSSPFLISSISRTFTSGRADHTVTDTERKKVIKNTTLQVNSKRSASNDNSWAFTIGLFVIHSSE